MRVARLRRSLRALFVAASGLSAAYLGRSGPEAAVPPQEVLTLEGDVAGVHDPAVIKQGRTYYLFCTGGRAGQGMIPIRTSSNLKTWRQASYVFEMLPDWVARQVPQARNAWAPDISFHHGEVSPLLLRLVVRQPELGDRAGDNTLARSGKRGVPLD